MVTQSQGHYQRLTQRPVVTAHLAQTMSLLEMTRQELHEKLTGDLADNPALELLEERRCPTCGRALGGARLCSVCSYAGNLTPEEPLVFVAHAADFATPGPYRDEYTPVEEYSAEIEDLPTFVARQVVPELSAGEHTIATFILSSLNDDGLLTVPVAEIAMHQRAPISRVEAVQRKIQLCEPLGVGSSTHQEALLIQLEALAESRPVEPLAHVAVREALPLLTRNHADKLARQLNISLPKARRLIQFISENLNPYPASAYWGGARHAASAAPPRYTHPDAVISCTDLGKGPCLQVEILWPLRGTLRVNPELQEAARNAPSERAAEWLEMVERANLLVKCLNQRNHTLARLLTLLAKYQREFILYGPAHILPLTRARLAEELNLHESTISRAVAGKAVQLPSGQIIPLSRFFERSLNVRTALRTIIEQEEKPLSDTKLVRLLAEQGFEVARRTVAKYRAMEGILPAHQRG